MTAWLLLPDAQRRQILTQVAADTGFNEQVVEKDVWVTLMLEALFSLPGIGPHLVFKGGTSLSKGYGLLDRFSEDIDFAIDRAVLDFEGQLCSTQIKKKLRPASAAFMRDRLIPELSKRLLSMGIPRAFFAIVPKAGAVSDADPLPVYVHYQSLLLPSGYLNDKVEIEIGARSLLEPSEPRLIQSLIREVYPDAEFSGAPFPVATVWPGRTFLEKAFLLHETFLTPQDEALPKNRMSRHLYDLEKLMDTEYARQAMADPELYRHIVEHRAVFTPVGPRALYDQHGPASIRFIPPEARRPAWAADYEKFSQEMIGGQPLPFDALLERLGELQERFRNLAAG